MLTIGPVFAVDGRAFNLMHSFGVNP